MGGPDKSGQAGLGATPLYCSKFMHIKLFFIYSIILSVHFTSCSNFEKHSELIFDEIIYSEFSIGIMPTNLDRKDIEKEYSNLFKTYLIDFRAGRLFIPLSVVKLNKNGVVNCFLQPLSYKKENAYLKSTLSKSSIDYFNALLDSINTNNIDSIYDHKFDGMIYDGSYYYLSFRKENKIVSTHIFYINDAAKELKRFIEFLQYFLQKSEFDSVEKNNLFEKDFKHIFESNTRLSPIKVKFDGIFEEITPSAEELKKSRTN